MNEEVIEAMCRAYWNERGTFKWEREGEQYKESIRQRMRAAVRAVDEFMTWQCPHCLLRYESPNHACPAKNAKSELAATEKVLAPVSDPNRPSFSVPSVFNEIDLYVGRST